MHTACPSASRIPRPRRRARDGRHRPCSALGAGVAEMVIDVVFDVLRLRRVVERRPAAVGIELLLRCEQLGVAARAVIRASSLGLEFAVDLAVGALRARLAEDLILLRGEDLLPFLVRFLDRSGRLGGSLREDLDDFLPAPAVSPGSLSSASEQETAATMATTRDRDGFMEGECRILCQRVKGAITDEPPPFLLRTSRPGFVRNPFDSSRPLPIFGHARPRPARLVRHPLYYDIIFDADTPTEAAFLETVFARHAKSKGKSVLELACGSGRLLKALGERGWKPSGFDLNPAMLAFAATASTPRSRRTGLAGPHGVLPRPGEPALRLVHCLVSTFKYLSPKPTPSPASGGSPPR